MELADVEGDPEVQKRVGGRMRDDVSDHFPVWARFYTKRNTD